MAHNTTSLKYRLILLSARCLRKDQDCTIFKGETDPEPKLTIQIARQTDRVEELQP